VHDGSRLIFRLVIVWVKEPGNVGANGTGSIFTFTASYRAADQFLDRGVSAALPFWASTVVGHADRRSNFLIVSSQSWLAEPISMTIDASPFERVLNVSSSSFEHFCLVPNVRRERVSALIGLARPRPIQL